MCCYVFKTLHDVIIHEHAMLSMNYYVQVKGIESRCLPTWVLNRKVLTNMGIEPKGACQYDIKFQVTRVRLSISLVVVFE